MYLYLIHESLILLLASIETMHWKENCNNVEATYAEKHDKWNNNNCRNMLHLHSLTVYLFILNINNFYFYWLQTVLHICMYNMYENFSLCLLMPFVYMSIQRLNPFMMVFIYSIKQ